MVVHIVAVLASAAAATATGTIGTWLVPIEGDFLMIDPDFDKLGFDRQIQSMSGWITKVFFDATYNSNQFPGIQVQYTVKRGLPEGNAVVRQASDMELHNNVRNMNITATSGCDPTVMACIHNPCRVIEMNYVSASALDASAGKNRHFVTTNANAPLAEVDLYGWSMCNPMFGYKGTSTIDALPFANNNSAMEYSGEASGARLSMPNANLITVNDLPVWAYSTPTDWESTSKQGKELVCSSRLVAPYKLGTAPSSSDPGTLVGVMPFTSSNNDTTTQTIEQVKNNVDNSLAEAITRDSTTNRSSYTDLFAQLHRCVKLKMLVRDRLGYKGSEQNDMPETVPGCANTKSNASTKGNSQYATKPAQVPWGPKSTKSSQSYGYYDETHVTYNEETADSNSRSSVIWTDGTIDRSKKVNACYYRKTGQKTEYGHLFDMNMRMDITPGTPLLGCDTDIVPHLGTSAHFVVYYKGGSTVAPVNLFEPPKDEDTTNTTNVNQTSATNKWIRMNVAEMFNRSSDQGPYTVSEWDLWSVNRLKETGLVEMANDDSNPFFASSPGYCLMTRCMGMNSTQAGAFTRPERNYPTGEITDCLFRFGTMVPHAYLHAGEGIDTDSQYFWSNQRLQEQCTTMQYATHVDDDDYRTARNRKIVAASPGTNGASYQPGLSNSHWTAGGNYESDDYGHKTEYGTSSTNAHIGCNTQVLVVADNYENMTWSIHRAFLNTSTDKPVAITLLGSATRGCSIKEIKNVQNNQKIWGRNNKRPRAPKSTLKWEQVLDYRADGPYPYAYEFENPAGWVTDALPLKATWGKEPWLYDYELPNPNIKNAPAVTTSADPPWYTPFNPYFQASKYEHYQCPIGIKADAGASLHELQYDKGMPQELGYILDVQCTTPKKPADGNAAKETDPLHKAHQLLYSVQDVEDCNAPLDKEATQPGVNVFENSMRSLSGSTVSMMMFRRDLPGKDPVLSATYGDKDNTVFKQPYPQTYGDRANADGIYATYEDYTMNLIEPIYDTVCPVFGNTGGPCAWLPEAPEKAHRTPTKAVCCDARNVDYNSGLCVTSRSDTSFRAGLQYNNALDQKEHIFKDKLETHFDVTGAQAKYKPLTSTPLATIAKTAVPPSTMDTPCDCGSTQPAYYCYSMPWSEAIQKGGYAIAHQILARLNGKAPSSSILKWCGFGWKDMINVNTPAIGLYLQSRQSPIVVSDRDILDEADVRRNTPSNGKGPVPYYRDRVQAMLFARNAPASDILETLQYDPKGTNIINSSFPHGCIRWPYGQVSQFELEPAYREVYFPDHLHAANGRDYEFNEGALINYCELIETSPTGADITLNKVRRQLPHCANDGMALSERTLFCSDTTHTDIVYSLSIGYRSLDDVCNSRLKVCFVVPGSRDWGTIANILRVDRDFTGYTLLISPFNVTMYESMSAYRFSLSTVREDNLSPYIGPTVKNGTFLADKSLHPMHAFPEFYTHVLDKLDVNASRAIQLVTNMMNTLAGTTVNILPSPGSKEMFRTVNIQEMMPPILEMGIRVVHANLTIRSASNNHTIVMARSETATRKLSARTCTRFYAGREGFHLHNVSFNMDGCNTLPPPMQVPVYLVGLSARASVIRVRVFCSISCTLAVAVAVLGDASSFMPSTPYLDTNGLTVRVCTSESAHVRFAAAYARITGASTVLYDKDTTVLLQDTVNQEIGETITGKGGANCQDVAGPVRRRRDVDSSFHILNITQYTDVFGDALERRLFHRPVDITGWYVPVIVINLVLVFGISLFQIAMMIHGQTARQYLVSHCMKFKTCESAERVGNEPAWQVVLLYDARIGREIWTVRRPNSNDVVASELVLDMVSGRTDTCNVYPTGLREALLGDCKKEL